jgi:hypothetical protein
VGEEDACRESTAGELMKGRRSGCTGCMLVREDDFTFEEHFVMVCLA